MIAEAEPWPDCPDLSPVWPLRPSPTVIVPKGGDGALAAQSQEGLNSLGTVDSITSTALSIIARNALDKFMALSDDDPRKTRYNIWLLTDFVEYLERCESSGFSMKGYDTVQGKIRTVPMSYENRWGVVRRRELSEKLKRLEFWFEMQEDRPVTMITLTCAHAGMTVASAWYELNKSRVKLLKLVAKYFDSPDYFWVPEPHPKEDAGFVHYHLAVFAEVDNYTRDTSKHVGWVKCKERQDEDIWDLMDGQGIEDKFRDLWERKYKTGSHTYGLEFSQKKGDEKIVSLKKYLTKYLEKGFLLGDWSIGQLIFNANLHETGFRMYGASRAIRKMMNIEDDIQKYDVIYSWKENEFHSVLDDLGKGYAELIEKRFGSDIVWLETRLESLEVTPEGEEVSIDKVIWYRQYIPDWLDSDFWVWKGELRVVDPPPIYIYEWGRKCRDDASIDLMKVSKPRYKRKIQVAGGEWIEIEYETT